MCVCACVCAIDPIASLPTAAASRACIALFCTLHRIVAARAAPSRACPNTSPSARSALLHLLRPRLDQRRRSHEAYDTTRLVASPSSAAAPTCRHCAGDSIAPPPRRGQRNGDSRTTHTRGRSSSLFRPHQCFSFPPRLSTTALALALATTTGTLFPNREYRTARCRRRKERLMASCSEDAACIWCCPACPCSSSSARTAVKLAVRACFIVKRRSVPCFYAVARGSVSVMA